MTSSQLRIPRRLTGQIYSARFRTLSRKRYCSQQPSGSSQQPSGSFSTQAIAWVCMEIFRPRDGARAAHCSVFLLQAFPEWASAVTGLKTLLHNFALTVAGEWIHHSTKQHEQRRLKSCRRREHCIGKVTARRKRRERRQSCIPFGVATELTRSSRCSGKVSKPHGGPVAVFIKQALSARSACHSNWTTCCGQQRSVIAYRHSLFLIRRRQQSCKRHMRPTALLWRSLSFFTFR